MSRLCRCPGLLWRAGLPAAPQQSAPGWLRLSSGDLHHGLSTGEDRSLQLGVHSYLSRDFLRPGYISRFVEGLLGLSPPVPESAEEYFVQLPTAQQALRTE